MELHCEKRRFDLDSPEKRKERLPNLRAEACSSAQLASRIQLIKEKARFSLRQKIFPGRIFLNTYTTRCRLQTYNLFHAKTISQIVLMSNSTYCCLAVISNNPCESIWVKKLLSFFVAFCAKQIDFSRKKRYYLLDDRKWSALHSPLNAHEFLVVVDIYLTTISVGNQESPRFLRKYSSTSPVSI